jgi:hypothetical protein
MPKHSAEELHASSLKTLVEARNLTHLRVRRRGPLLVLESGPEDDPVPHVRFRRQGAHIWQLEFATHKGTWELTPLRGTLRETFELVERDFGWTLEPIA